MSIDIGTNDILMSSTKKGRRPGTLVDVAKGKGVDPLSNLVFGQNLAIPLWQYGEAFVTCEDL